MEVVTVKGVYSADDLVGARLYMTRRNPFLRVLRFFPLLVPVMMAVFYVVSGRITSSNAIGLAVFSCVMIIVGSLFFSRFISRPIQRFLTRRQMNSSPIMTEEKLFRFDLAGLHWEQESSQGTLDWIGVLTVEENENGFFILTGKNFAHFVPRRFFDGPEDLSRVREIICAALPGKTKLIGG